MTEDEHGIDVAVIQRIDELCDEMDREDMNARLPIGHGRTFLDSYRAYWLRLACEGSPLPTNWHNGEKEEQFAERFATCGTREWRKAYPWLVERMRKAGRNV